MIEMENGDGQQKGKKTVLSLHRSALPLKVFLSYARKKAGTRPALSGA